MIQIAHRGHSNFFKDNTLPAFIDAVENNFEMIELDIVLTKDNKIAIYHDTFINNKLIKDLHFEELNKIDKDIILFETFLKIIDTKKIKIYIDVKGSNDISIHLDKILKNIDLNNIYIASFNTIILSDMQKLNKDYQLGLITENLFEDEIFYYYIDKFNLKFIAFHWTMLEKHTIDMLHKKNISVFVYTCKNNNILLFMKKFDVDGIVTNYKINNIKKNNVRKKKKKTKI
jgi:glycerophosphoryl diester phosphodiesterase